MKSEIESSKELALMLGRILNQYGEVKPLSCIEFLENDFFVGVDLRQEQKTFFKLVYNDSLSKEDHRTIEYWKDGDPPFTTDIYIHPGTEVEEVVLVCGKRSAKTFLGSCLACYETYKYLLLPDPCKHYGLAPRSPVFGMIAATSKDVAKDTVFAQIKAKIEDSPFFNLYQNPDNDITKFEAHFPSHHFTIRAGASTSGALVGRTNLFSILDELAYLKNSKGQVGGKEVYAAITGGNKTLRGMAISLTSPVWVQDQAMTLLNFAKNDPSMLGLRIPTWIFNSTFSFQDFKREFEKNPTIAARDFGALPSAAIEPFFRDPEAIDRVCHLPLVTKDGKLTARARGKTGYLYIMASDTGLRRDAFSIAVGHRDKKRYVIDLVFRFKPENIDIDANAVHAFCFSLLERYLITDVVLDTVHFPILMQDLSQHVEVTTRVVRYADYELLRALVHKQMISIPNHPILKDELKALELVDGKKVDHRRDTSKDMSDAVVNCIVKLSESEVDNETPFFV